jgi:hypothetical protein
MTNETTTPATPAEADDKPTSTRESILGLKGRRRYLKRTVTLKNDDADAEPIEITIRCRSMSAKEHSAFERIFRAADGKPNERRNQVREYLALFCGCDDAGRLIFRPDDVEEMSAVDTGVFLAYAALAMELNDITEDDIADLEGNLFEAAGETT